MAFTSAVMLLAFLVASATSNPFSTPAPTTTAPGTTCVVMSPMMFIAPGATQVVHTAGSTVCVSYTCEGGNAPPVSLDCGAQSLCVDETNTAQCACAACSGGSSGQTSNACEPTSPCVNGGTCTAGATAGTYTCACPAPYHGTNCDLSYCAPSPCQNNGACVGDSSRTPSYRCDCAPGYSDNHCQTAACSASTPPCVNNEVCSMNSTAPSGYVCTCPAGFGGTTCNECADQDADCPAWAATYCNDAIYGPWMQTNCRLSCQLDCSA